MDFSDFPTHRFVEFHKFEMWGCKRGEYITAFSRRKQLLPCSFFSCAPFSSRGRAENSFLSAFYRASKAQENHALTNFFDLSNIRFDSGGSSEMLRTSRCSRTVLFQLDGTWTLTAAAPYVCHFPSLSSKFPPSGRAARLARDGFGDFLSVVLEATRTSTRVCFSSVVVDGPTHDKENCGAFFGRQLISVTNHPGGNAWRTR